jgi:hypothetical protein
MSHGAFRDLPLYRKLLLVLLLTAGSTLLLSLIIVATGLALKLRHDAQTQLVTLARTIANNSQAAMAFGDEGGGREVLAALRAEPSIVMACLTRVDGKEFARYATTDAKNLACGGKPTQGAFFTRLIEIVEPVVLHGEVLGELHAVADISAAWRTLQVYLLDRKSVV